MPDGLGDAMVFALGFFLTITIVGLVLIVVWELMTKHRRLRLLVFFLLSIPISAIAGGLASSIAVFFVCLATLNTMIISCDNYLANRPTRRTIIRIDHQTRADGLTTQLTLRKPNGRKYVVHCTPGYPWRRADGAIVPAADLSVRARLEWTPETRPRP
jgi:hypothetical protein